MDRRNFIQGTLTATAVLGIAGQPDVALADEVSTSRRFTFDFGGASPEEALERLDAEKLVSKGKWRLVDPHGTFWFEPLRIRSVSISGERQVGEWTMLHTVQQVRDRLGRSRRNDVISRWVEINVVSANMPHRVAWVLDEHVSKICGVLFSAAGNEQCVYVCE
jgi:hypothetical protein